MELTFILARARRLPPPHRLANSTGVMPFVELDRSLVLFCRCPGRKRAQIAAAAGLRIFLREYNRYLPDASLRIMALPLLKISLHNQSFLRRGGSATRHEDILDMSLVLPNIELSPIGIACPPRLFAVWDCNIYRTS